MVRKPPRLPHVKFVKARTRYYAYFDTGAKKAGKPIYTKMPDPASVCFYDSYAALMAVRTKRAGPTYTVADLVDDYESSETFRKLSAGTQKTYKKYTHRIAKAFKAFSPDGVTRKHVRAYADKEFPDTPGAYNLFVSVVGAVYKWGRKNDKTTVEPTKELDKRQIGEHEPWPDHVLEEALSTDDDRIRLVVHILYFTGLRIGDALALRWSDLKDGFVHIRPQKTARLQKMLRIKIAQELADELAKTPRRGMTMVAQENGKPVGYAIMLRDLKQFTADLGVDVVPHGLRKNAVNALLEAGCTIAEVSAITGQTFRIVEHYAKKMDVGSMSEAAIIKLETRRKRNAP